MTETTTPLATPTQYRISRVPPWAPAAHLHEVYIHWHSWGSSYGALDEGWFLRAHDGLYLDSEGDFINPADAIPMERGEAKQVAEEILDIREARHGAPAVRYC